MSLPFVDLKFQYQQLKDDVNTRIQQVLEHGKYIMGPEVYELEQSLAEYAGSKHCVSCSSGTDALFLAMKALGVEAGDEVITTPFTFIATGEMIALIGAKPVFVDIDPKTYNINPELIEAAITEKTKAIMPVSLYGQCADFDAINLMAEKYHIPVIEDAAQSFGASYKGRKSCNLSTVGCTSFFPSKPLGCYGDGGACFTNDDDVAEMMRTIRSHGQTKRYHHEVIGFNGRLDTLQAAILLAKFALFPDEVIARARIGDRYSELFGEKIVAPFIEDGNTSVYAQYTIQVENRECVQNTLKEVGIPFAVHYPTPLHLQPAFEDLDLKEGSFPIAEEMALKVLSLPMHPYLSSADQGIVVDNVLKAIK